MSSKIRSRKGLFWGALLVWAPLLAAPGRLAETRMVGSSTLGMLATGRKRYATIPTSIRPIASRMVPTGRMMNG